MSSLIEDSKGFDLPIKTGLVKYWRAKDVRRDKNGVVWAIQEFMSKFLDYSITATLFYHKYNDTDFNGNETLESNNGGTEFPEITLTNPTIYIVTKKVQDRFLATGRFHLYKSEISWLGYYPQLASVTNGTPNQVRRNAIAPDNDRLKLITVKKNHIYVDNIECAYDTSDNQTGSFIFNELAHLTYSKYGEIAIYDTEHDTTQMTIMWNHFNSKYGIDAVVYPDLMFHLDAGIGITTVNDGTYDRVDTWADQSTYLRHATAPSAILRPRYIASDTDFNNLPSVFADIQPRELTHYPLYADSFTIHYVMKETQGRVYGVFHMASKTVTNNASQDINLYNGSPMIISRRFVTGSVEKKSTQNITNVSKVVTFTKDRIFINGIESAYLTTPTFPGGCGFSILFQYQNPYFFTGKIAEIKGYCSEHSDAQILSEAQSLMTKYGIV